MSYVAPFRDTHLLDGSGRGHKKLVSHRNMSESVYIHDDEAVDVAVGAPLQQPSPAGAQSKQQGRHHTKRHMAAPGGGLPTARLLASEQAAAAAWSAPEAAAAALSPARPPRAVGGQDSIVLGAENGGRFASTHGIKEEAMRVAADPEARRHVEELSRAGMRPSEKLQRRTTHAPGGMASVQLGDGEGARRAMPSEGMDEAQRRSALDPAARQLVEEQSPAGTRILRAVGLRVSQPAGGLETGGRFEWPSSALNAAPAAPAPAAGGTDGFASARPSPAQVHAEVGGRSAPYLPHSAMTSLLQQQPDSARPGTASGRAGSARANESSSVTGMFRSLSGQDEPQAAAPRSPARRPQPVGGLGNLNVLSSQAVPAPVRTGVRQLGVQHVSNITLG